MTPATGSMGLTPIVPGYSLSARCWEDPLSITFSGLDASTSDPVFIRMAKARRFNSTSSSPFRRDFEIASKIDCKAVLKPAYLSNEDGIEFLILPDDGRRPLAELLLHRRLTLAQSIELLASIAEGLGEVHRASVVHCNINPHSVWPDRELQSVGLADFSRAIAAGEVPEERHLQSDLHYSAPEQSGRMGHIVDNRADLYSVGALTYYLLCGTPPFDQTEPLELLHAHLARTPVPPHLANPHTPVAVSNIAMKLLSKPVEDRYQTAAGLAFDLNECLTQLRSHGRIDLIQIGAADVPVTFRISEKLYGRETELAALRAAQNRVMNGGVEVVLISGPPGIGKSLLAKAIEADSGSNCMFVSGKFDQYKQNEPYAVMAQAFSSLIEKVLCGSEEALRNWRERLQDKLGVNGQLIVGVVPELEMLIGPQPPLQELPAAEKRHRFNHVFREFVRTFANSDSPLCLFLDDLQWADPASLSLLQTLLKDSEMSHLLVIGAYRDGEKTSADLAQYIDETSNSTPVSRIRLASLSVAQIGELLTDSLRCRDNRQAVQLAGLVKTKTDGNPFFVTQFLSFLVDQKLLDFDFSGNCWTWETSRIAAEGVTDDVLELMKGKLIELPDLTQQALKVAACIGNSFDASTLCLVMDKPITPITIALRQAEREGLLVSLTEADHSGKFKFLHDRIQQAAYALISESSRPALRLQIGRKLLASTPAIRTEGDFVALDNLNEAIHLIEDRAERDAVSQLNALAGRRAREVAAFDAALNYFRNGMTLLPADGWQSRYDLTLELHLGRFECAYILGFVEEANTLFRGILEHSRGNIDKADAYYLKILLHTGMDRSDEAVAVGLEALRLFNQRIPQSPTKLQLFRELAIALVLLRGRPAKGLTELPRMTDAGMKAAVTLLMSICPAAYFRNPDLMILAALRIMSISLRYGNAPASSFGYVLYGLARGALFGDYKGGQEFGRLAVELARQDADPIQQCKIIAIFAGWLSFWREPINRSIELLGSSLKLALEAGDVQYAHYSVLQTIFLRFARGVPLDELSSDLVRYQAIIEQAPDWFTLTTYGFRKRIISALQNQTTSWHSPDEKSSREEDLVSELHSAGNLTALTYYLVLKTQLAYLLGDFSDACGFSDEAETRIDTVVNQIVVVDHYFYRGLNSASLIRRNIGENRKLWKTLKGCAAKMKRYARNCPENFAPHSLLLEAQIASLNGHYENAVDWLEEAARLAREQEFIQIEALANELAGEICLTKNRDHFARIYFVASVNLYKRWGAAAKVDQLTKAYARLLGQEVERAGTDATHDNGAAASRRYEVIDLSTVVQASADLSAEMESDRLLNKLMRLILESMGAERAFIVSSQNGSLRIDAAGSTDGTQIRFHREPSLNGEHRFSESVVNYVLHTGRRVILEDARTDPRFKSCPYVAGRQPRSIACVPLARMGTVFGVSYVENRLVSGAFSAERMRGLVLLSQQISAAIENIQLQSQLKQNNATLQAALQDVEFLEGIRGHLAKFVPQSLQRLIESNPENPDFAAREEDVSILFLDIAGSTSMSERHGSEELQRIIERYFSGFIEDIHRNGGDISEVTGDGLMILFQDTDPLEHARMATRTAMAIREKTKQLNAISNGEWPSVVINIGIHSGVSLVGANKIESPAGIRWVYTATGYVANVAARVGAAATNGAILVSEATASRLGTEFELSDRGAQSFKGVSQPIKVFSVGRSDGP